MKVALFNAKHYGYPGKNFSGVLQLWLDNNPNINIKFIKQSAHSLYTTAGAQAYLVITIWYEDK